LHKIFALGLCVALLAVPNFISVGSKVLILWGRILGIFMEREVADNTALEIYRLACDSDAFWRTHAAYNVFA